jgi:DNA-binding CsgD family transcriptional regulator/PAS domain-containing protein
MDGDVYERSFDQLLHLVYDAAVNAATWRKFLEALTKMLRGDVGVLFSQDNRIGLVIAECIGIEPALYRSCHDYYWAADPRMQRAANWPSGSTLVSHETPDERAVESSEWFDRWIPPEPQYHGIGSIVQRRKTALTHFGMLRQKPAGTYSTAEIALIRRLTPHVRRSVQMHQHLFAARLKAEGAMLAIDTLGIGVVLADAEAHIIFGNPAAERLLVRHKGLSVRQGLLVGSSPRSTDGLRALIKNAAMTGVHREQSSGGLWISETEVRPLSLLVCPLYSPGALLPIDRVDGCALLLINDPDRAIKPPPGELARIYGLTGAETKLLCAILGGQRLAEYAHRASITMNTVKTYMKNILGKTGTERQGDLLRIVMSNPLLQVGGPGEPDAG